MSSNERRPDADLARALREVRARNRLGDEPCCETCGDTNPVHLCRIEGITLCACCLAVGRGRDIFELHHVAGRHEGAVIRVCANCHSELTESQRGWCDGLDFDARFALGLEDISRLRRAGGDRG